MAWTHFPVASFFLTRINTITQQPTRFTLIQGQFRRRSFNPLFIFLNVFSRWNILWQGAANALDGISNFLATIFVCLDGMGLVAHAILRQLVASLRQAKLVGRELRGEYPGVCRNGVLYWDNELIRGQAWAVDELSLVFTWRRHDTPDAYLYEIIVINESNDHRSRTWHWFRDGAIYQRTLIDEVRVDA